jgi:hypothetical protein
MNRQLGKIVVIVSSIILFVILSQDTFAQCAMCRATVENNVSSGESSIGAGLNKGILFLLATPYTIFCVIAILWYRNSRKEYEKRLKIAGYSRSKMSPM